MSNHPHILESELLYFWAIGDLHYRAIEAWQKIHSLRLSTMFEDLQTLWQQEGVPSFCVSPGDMVETHRLENHLLAKKEITAHLGGVPFYPGTGNHEFWDPDGTDSINIIEEFSAVWEKPMRYSWTINGITCIMLDHPNLYKFPEYGKKPSFMPETLEFLEQTLAQHPDNIALIFAHCPLTHTVSGRSEELELDYTSDDPFFSAGNSDEVRAILARHSKGGLYLCGHTHSGWEAKNLIKTETLGEHSFTFINLMSPWYTGRHHGLRLNADRSAGEYFADEPDIQGTFAVRIYKDKAIVKVREHKTGAWLKEFELPLN